MRAAEAIALMAFGAVIALALLPLFPPVLDGLVSDAQVYVLRIKRNVLDSPGEISRSPVLPTAAREVARVNVPAPAQAAVQIEPTPILSVSTTREQLREYMLGLINSDRETHGLTPVVLGDNSAAQQHAEDKLAQGYSSHWGTDGLKPYMRYTLAGGYNYEAENSSGPAPLRDGVNYMQQAPEALLREAESSLMDSPGHRRNILNPWHKKVNLGIGCNEFTCSVVQQFEGDYVEFSQNPRIHNGILSLGGNLKGGFVFEGVHIWYDQPPHTLTLGQLDATYSYGVGQEPVTFLREPLSWTKFYLDSSVIFTWEAGLDPYSIDAGASRNRAPPVQTHIRRTKVVPWTTATVWSVSQASFDIKADISSVIAVLGPGVYTVIVWGNEGESVALTNYSIFLE